MIQTVNKRMVFFLITTVVLSVGLKTEAQSQALMSLEQCRELALEHNKQIQMAQADAVASDYLVQSAKTKYLPRIDFAGGWINPGDRPLRPFAINFNIPGVTPQGLSIPLDFISVAPKEVYTGGFILRQPIFMGFKIVEANKIARYTSELLHEKVKMEEADVLASVDEAYWRVISVQEKVTLAKTYKSLLDHLGQDLENLYDEGMTTRNEVLKVQVKKNEVELSLVKAENGLELSKMLLGQIIGVDANQIELDTGIISEEQLSSRLLALTNNDTIERAEIVMLRNKLAITESARKMVKSQFLPNIFLTAGYNWTQPNLYKGSQNNFGGDWMIGVGVQIPVLTWGDRLHQVHMADQQVAKAKLELQDSQEKINLQIQQNRFKHAEALKRMELTKLSKEQAEENLRITKNSLLEGMNSIRDILEAQVMWEKASSADIDARVEAAVTLSQLEKSTGALYKYAEGHSLVHKQNR
ncbi:TolC family protein [Porphyromonas endodontalis]|uniref:TolC family protein n=1 Tax=Porphyromonas endodontalis TaxID=28124 RepID=UPI0028E4BF8C|nr:TolC family protein [Porphyromonas endodontalis]